MDVKSALKWQFLSQNNVLCTAIRSNCAFITSYVRGSPSLLF